MTNDRDDALAALTEQVTRLAEQVTYLVQHLSHQAQVQRGEDPAETSFGDPLLTATQAADLLGVTESWVQVQTRRKQIPYRRLGRQVRYAREDLDELVKRSLKPGLPDALTLSARSLAAVRRGRRGREAGMPVTPRQLGPYDVPGVVPGTIPDPSRPRTARIVCTAYGRRVPSEKGRNALVDCPECDRNHLSLHRWDEATKTGSIGRHVAYIPLDTLRPDHVLWPGGEKGRHHPPIPDDPQPGATPKGNAEAPPVTVRCPGSGKSVQLDKLTPPRCPSCKRDDLEVPRFAPSKSFGLVPAHGKTVPADSTEATLPAWGDH